MKKREHISKIMSTDIVTVNLSNNLEDVNNLFQEKHIRHIPVVSGKHIIGMISYTDFMRITFNLGKAEKQINVAIFKTMTIEEVMTKDIQTISSLDTIRDAAEIFISKEFNALPVVDDDELVGIVTTTDVIKYLLSQY